MSKDKIRKPKLFFDQFEWAGLEAVDFCEGLISFEDDCLYYNGEYICPLCVPHVALYFALRAYCRGYKIGFQAGDDSRADYDFQNYVMFEKEAFERGDVDEHCDNA